MTPKNNYRLKKAKFRKPTFRENRYICSIERTEPERGRRHGIGGSGTCVPVRIGKKVRLDARFSPFRLPSGRHKG